MYAIRPGPIATHDGMCHLSSILLIEDETDVRELLSLHLTRLGHEVAGFATGEEALEEVDRRSFDLAVVDWMLPGMSGIDLAKKLAGQMPILMVTARAESRDIVHGLESGADDYITKPFD